MPDELEQRCWKKFAQGDADIWRQFIDRQIPRLYRLFMKSWPNPSLAEELVQRTVFDAVRGSGSFNPDKGSPEEWIYGIARNTIRLELRRRASRPGTNGEIGRYFDAIDTKLLPNELLERQETIEIVRAALGKLESKEETVLRAKYIEDLPTCEIAAEMKMTEKAVHSLLYRARISLRRQLKQMALESKQGQKS
ncbi:MAG: sigma-70 family RNA polymerase sigma factor [Sedimentisphaerales bacterium]|nr:sigma-70 family RNA polymerase sigma factor [Sedimentisphaerales bacterium]